MFICQWWFYDTYVHIKGQKIVFWDTFWATVSPSTEFNRKRSFFGRNRIFPCILGFLCEPESVSVEPGGIRCRVRQPRCAREKCWGPSWTQLISSSAHMPLPWHCTLPETVPLVPGPAIGTCYSPAALLQQRTSQVGTCQLIRRLEDKYSWCFSLLPYHSLSHLWFQSCKKLTR